MHNDKISGDYMCHNTREFISWRKICVKMEYGRDFEGCRIIDEISPV